MTEKENVNCNLCNSNAADVLFPVDFYKLVKCRKCGLVYVSPRPTSCERENINKEIYDSQEYRTRYFRDRKIFEKWFKKKLSDIERYSRKGKILDVGTSYGFFLDVARKRGWETYGIEKNIPAVRYAREKLGLNISEGTTEEAQFPENFFDVITLWDVLEHIPDPTTFLRRLKTVLKRDGLVCIQSPNIESLIADYKKERWDWLTPNDHLSHFSPSTLRAILGKTGYKLISMATWEPTAYFIDAFLGFEDNKSFLFRFYRKTILRVIRKFFFFFFLPFQWLEKSKDKGALIVAYAKAE